MTQNTVNEAAWNLTRALRDSNQAVVESAVAAQERNMKFAQAVLENGIEVLKSHAESTRNLTQELVSQPQQQQGALKAIAESAVTAQERNMKFAQSIFEDGINVLKSHTESTRALMQTLTEQAQKEQEAFQALVQESMDAYKDFFYAPLSYFQQAFDATEAAARRGVENFQKATQQVVESGPKATRQAANAARKAAE